MGENASLRPRLVLAATAVCAILIAQVAIAGSSDSGPRATESLSVVKQIRKLKQRVGALEAKPDQVGQVPSSLPPSGPAGGDLDGSYPGPSLRSPEAVTEVGLVQSPAGMGCTGLTNSWNDFASLGPAGFVFNRAGYYRDRGGRVHLQGYVLQCGTPPTNIFTLPNGYRPARTEVQATVISDLPGTTTSHGTIRVEGAGAVHPTPNPGTEKIISLDGVSFRCAPAGQNGCP